MSCPRLRKNLRVMECLLRPWHCHEVSIDHVRVFIEIKKIHRYGMKLDDSFAEKRNVNIARTSA